MLISIILPNYNHSIYLNDAINGILSQSYCNWELIIVDDGSTDNSKDIIQKFAAIDNRIKPIYLKDNTGVLNAISIAQKSINGKFLLSHAADDYFCNPNYFINAINEFKKTDTLVAYFSKTVLIDYENNFLKNTGHSMINGVINKSEYEYMFRKSLIFIPGTSSIFRKDIFDLLGGFDFSFEQQTDYFLTHFIPFFGDLFYNNEIVSKMRFHTNSYGNSQSMEDNIKIQILMYNKFSNFNNISNNFKSIYYKKIINNINKFNLNNDLMSYFREKNTKSKSHKINYFYDLVLWVRVLPNRIIYNIKSK